tara:strand:- start:191 stop:631 length:441 start_codon:yes stop_codon:yes gene_type:complete
MATLTGKQIKDTYDSVLKLQDNAALSSSLKTITDGLGNATGLSLSDTEVKSTVDVEASGFKTPTGTSSQYLMADGSVGTNAGDLNFIHNQGVASASWSITHNLNKFPSITVIDSANRVVVGAVEYININSLTITFTASFSGKAYLN